MRRMTNRIIHCMQKKRRDSERRNLMGTARKCLNNSTSKRNCRRGRSSIKRKGRESSSLRKGNWKKEKSSKVHRKRIN